jgi:hypothetical protein
MYHYAQSLLIPVAVSIVMFLLMPHERLSMFKSGVAILPAVIVFGPAADSYWKPERLFQAIVGLEDFTFMFCEASQCWGFVALRYGPLPRITPFASPAVLRIAPIALLGTAVFFGTHVLGLSYGLSAVACQTAAALAVIALRPGLAGTSGFAALSFLIFYLAGMALARLLFGPDFAAMWQFDTMLGPTVFGLPIEEYLWAASFGAVWVPLLLYSSEKVQQTPQP